MSSSSHGNLVSSALKTSFVDQQTSVTPPSTSSEPFTMSTTQIHLSAIQTTLPTNQGIGHIYLLFLSYPVQTQLSNMTAKMSSPVFSHMIAQLLLESCAINFPLPALKEGN